MGLVCLAEEDYTFKKKCFNKASFKCLIGKDEWSYFCDRHRGNCCVPFELEDLVRQVVEVEVKANGRKNPRV